MSKTSIPPKIQAALWAQAAGRCQFRGCNKPLIGDLVAGRRNDKFGFIAHIVADEPRGPRGDTLRSPALARSLSNLMLMCAEHHRLIDVVAPADYPEAVLLKMKAEHEERVDLVAGIDRERASYVLRCAAKIGNVEALVSIDDIFSSMLPEHFPASRQTIDLEMVGCAFADHEKEFWDIQVENLRRQFESSVRGRIERQDIKHLSVFALAPQPLLIELGTLLGDIVPVRVHQRHREPTSWKWQPDQPPIQFLLSEPAEFDGAVALKLALSATVEDDRIRRAVGPNAAIWSLTADNPHNDILRRPEDQVAFRQHVRRLLDRIKARHGNGTTIHVFPALPNSAAVELGRVRMPKVDLPFLVFDANKKNRDFHPTTRVD